MNPITLNLNPIIKLTDDQFYNLATAHQDLQMERTPTGELVIMPPTGGESGKRNADLIADLVMWNRSSKLGIVFDSSTEFNLPLGGDRSPDVSWIRLERWNALSKKEQEVFPPICPDFVIELRSRTDRLAKLQEKMQEYITSGLRLGWLINPQDLRVDIYRQGQDVEVLQSPTTLSGVNDSNQKFRQSSTFSVVAN